MLTDKFLALESPERARNFLMNKREVLKYINGLGFKFPESKFRYYIREKLLPKGIKVKGKGNRIFYNPDMVRVILNAIKFYEKQGYELREIKRKISVYFSSSGEQADFKDNRITDSYKSLLRSIMEENLKKTLQINLSCYENMLIHLQASRRNSLSRSERNYRYFKQLYHSDLSDRDILYRRFLFRFRYDIKLAKKASFWKGLYARANKNNREIITQTCRILKDSEKLTLWRFAQKYSLIVYHNIKEEKILDPSYSIAVPDEFKDLKTPLKAKYLEHIRFMRARIKNNIFFFHASEKA